MNKRIKGDGLFKIRNNVIYVHGSLNGVFYRKSTGKKVTPTTKQWIKKANPLEELVKLLNKEKNMIATNNFEEFGKILFSKSLSSSF